MAAAAEFKAELGTIVDDFVAQVAALDDGAGYHPLCARARGAVDEAMARFFGMMKAQIKESREVQFARKYGQPSELVRQQYIQLLEDNSRNDDMQHAVHVHGYNAKRAHHWGLKPEAYEFCKPDARVLAAFAVIDRPCRIEAKPHFEHWGN